MEAPLGSGFSCHDKPISGAVPLSGKHSNRWAPFCHLPRFMIHQPRKGLTQFVDCFSTAHHPRWWQELHPKQQRIPVAVSPNKVFVGNESSPRKSNPVTTAIFIAPELYLPRTQLTIWGLRQRGGWAPRKMYIMLDHVGFMKVPSEQLPGGS